MFDKKIFSERLVSIRTSKGIMAKDVALALGVSKPSMSQFEKGISAPSAITLVALADYFDVSLDYLVGRSDVPERR